MVFDGLRCFQKPKIAGKCPVLSQRVAGPYEALVGAELLSVITCQNGRRHVSVGWTPGV